MEATRTANVRETPFPTATRVGQLEAGSFVWAVGETTTQGGTWYKVARDGVELGFVYGPLLASVGSNDTVINVEPLPAAEVQAIAASEETASEEPEQREEPQSVHDELSFLVEDLLQEVAPADAVTPEPSPEPVQSTQTQSVQPQPAQSTYQPPGTEPPVQQPQAQSQVQQAQVQFPAQSTPEPQASTSRERMVPTATMSESKPDEPAATDESLSPAETYAMGAALSEVLTTGSGEEITSILQESGAPQQVIDEFVAAVETAPPEARDMMANIVKQAAVDQAQMLVQEQVPAADPMDMTAAEPDPVQQSRTTQSAQQIAMVTEQPSFAKQPEPQPEPETSRYVRRYVTAAESGNSQAMLALGYMYETGDQVTMDKQEAIKWYTMAGDAGEVDAMISLALLYESGNGVRKNLTEAAIWYRKAATAGHADAQQTLGYIYENGSGVVKDVVEAARWYERAALQGRVAAQNNLGRFYQLGIGVPQDLDQAVYWYEKAAAQGSEAAKGNLDKLIVAPAP
jgi:polyhydroxyalkanoate synthesis regulator phasin